MWLAPAVVVVALSPILALVVVIGAVFWRRWSSARCVARNTRQICTDFPDALDLLVLSIRAGYLPAQAVVEITPFLPHQLQPAFTAVSDAMQHGDRFADALVALRSHLGPIAQPLVDSLSAADRYGLPLAPVLERLAFEARSSDAATATPPPASCRFAWQCPWCCAPCRRSCSWPSSPCSSEPCRRCTPERPNRPHRERGSS
jgi:Flp pilus assembly protein TadB